MEHFKFHFITHTLKEILKRGAWVAQLVERLTLAQVMISRSVSSSPALGSGLMAQSLELASDSVSPSLSAPPPLVLCLSKINKCKKKLFLRNKGMIF